MKIFKSDIKLCIQHSLIQHLSHHVYVHSLFVSFLLLQTLIAYRYFRQSVISTAVHCILLPWTKSTSTSAHCILLPFTNSDFYFCPYLAYYSISCICAADTYHRHGSVCSVYQKLYSHPNPLHTWRTLPSTSLGQRKHLDLVVLLLEDSISLTSIRPRVSKPRLSAWSDICHLPPDSGQVSTRRLHPSHYVMKQDHLGSRLYGSSQQTSLVVYFILFCKTITLNTDKLLKFIAGSSGPRWVKWISGKKYQGEWKTTYMSYYRTLFPTISWNIFIEVCFWQCYLRLYTAGVHSTPNILMRVK